VSWNRVPAKYGAFRPKICGKDATVIKFDYLHPPAARECELRSARKNFYLNPPPPTARELRSAGKNFYLNPPPPPLMSCARPGKISSRSVQANHILGQQHWHEIYSGRVDSPLFKHCGRKMKIRNRSRY